MVQILPTLLLVLFIGLKLAKIIDWSWWWVMSPLWVVVLVTLLAVALMVIARALETPRQRAARLAQELADAIGRRRL